MAAGAVRPDRQGGRRWGRIGRTRNGHLTFPTPATATELARQLERRFAYLGDPAGQRVVVMLDEIERVFPGVARPRPRAGGSGPPARCAHLPRAAAGTSWSSARTCGRPPTGRTTSATGRPIRSSASSRRSRSPCLTASPPAKCWNPSRRAMGVNTVIEEFIEKIFAMTGGHPVAGQEDRSRGLPGARGTQDGWTSLTWRPGWQAWTRPISVGSFIRNNLWQPMTTAEKQIAHRPRRVGGSRASPPAASGARTWPSRKARELAVARDHRRQRDPGGLAQGSGCATTASGVS